MKKVSLYLAALVLCPALALGLAHGGVGLLVEYDNNVFGDYWGGSSLKSTAYLDLGLDRSLGLWGLVLRADYKGDFNTYLQYPDMGQSDHDLSLLLWRAAGEDGYLAWGGGMEYMANGAGRVFCDSRYLYGAAEGKLYLGPSLLARFSAQYGPQTYLQLSEYDCQRLSGDLSASLFFPSRTSVSIRGLAKRYIYLQGTDSLKLPRDIYHIEPGLILTQALAPNLGLSVEYSGLINKISTAAASYHPDTLLLSVEDYWDYRGGRARARLTARGRRAGLVLGAGWRFLDYTDLAAYESPGPDTISLARRRSTADRRWDRVRDIVLDQEIPWRPSLKFEAGLEYMDHRSNDLLFDYRRIVLGLGLKYDL